MVYVTDLLILVLTGRGTNEIELAFLPMKTEAFNQMEPMAAQNLTLIFPFFVMCVYLLPLYYMVTKLAEEKESRGREGMIMMGLKHETYFFSWFLFLFAIVLTMSIILVLSASLKIFVQSNLLLILAMCCLYGMTMFGFAFLIVALFPTKKSSATAASLVHLLSYYVGFMYSGHQTTHVVKLFVSLIPNAALTFMLEHLLQCEFQGSGLSMEFAAMQVQGISFNEGLIMLVIDVVVLAFIGYYFDQVMPKEYGVAKPWNFLCVKVKRISIGKNTTSSVQDQEKVVSQANFEEVSPQVQRDSYALKVCNLRKVFDNGKVAVDSTSMTMYSGQIFALLGHNGAGKTTTISTLTGLLSPTQGTAELEDVDIFENQDYLRKNLGVCPQHNVLFDYLSVREHLELYAAFKGIDSLIINKRVDKMLYEVELVENQYQLAKTLSGGQRRKLSVAIALIGDAKIIMLDEPTSGMDTTTRRRFWEMVKQYKQGRIIILTTHYMDEADILGDRICIMAEGNVQCCGSSLFLKNRFGVGYNLVLAKQQGGPGVKSDLVTQFIQKRLPEATKLQEVSTEISYQLPITVSPKFKDFFTALDKDLSKLGLSSYGVGITTLEEVFLRIGHGEDHATTVDKIKAQTADLSKLTPREKELTNYSIATDHRRNFFSHFVALVKKKVLVMIRDPKSFLMDFFFPIILITTGLYVSQIDLISEDYPKRALSAYDFPQGNPLIYNQHNFNQTEDEVESFIERSFSSDIGPGKMFSHAKAVDTNLSSNFFEQAAEIDDEIFEQRLLSGPSYGGQFLVQQVQPEDRYYSIAMFVNASSPAAPMSYCSYALQAVMRDMTDNPNLKLNFHEKPLPFGFKIQSYINAGQGVIAAMGFAVAYMMMADQIVQSIIKERQTNVKHQIMVSGASKLAYWSSHFFVDFLYHQLIAGVTRLTVHLCEIDAPDIEHLFFTFSLVNPLFVYSISFLFDTDSKASVLVRVLYFALGGVAPIAIQVLQVVNQRTIVIGKMLAEYFYQWPIYNLNLAYLSIINRKMVALLKNQDEDSLQPLDWDVAGEPIFNMYECLKVCLAFVLVIELGFYKHLVRPIVEPLSLYAGHYYKALRPLKRRKLYNMRKDCHKIDIEASDDEEDRRNTLAARKFLRIVDTDPQKEEQRVIQKVLKQQKDKKNQAALTISKLSKQYVLGEKAVNNLSLSLEPGECFALLGVTGAGKSTTFKCLTGEEIPDEGTLYMGGHDVRSRAGFDAARCTIGYCPQFDAIFENLTVWHHLDFYASIKGVRSDYKSELIAKQIKEMDLGNFTNVNAGQLSGGNKRKLQCAIALIGNPPIVLLDEPSTGVDPQAKRFMWTIISNISTLRKQSTVVLTTHSMEEAEALCTKMGIMVDGQFKCFGSSQHIKDKYGMGFELEIKIRSLSDLEIVEEKKKRGVASEAVSKLGLDSLMRKLGHSELSPEICEGGLGDDLNRILLKTGKLYVDELMKWAHIERNGGQIIAQLERLFSEFQQVEHYNNSYTFKVSRDHHSIGSVFGMLEDFKAKYSIQEYSAQQTSLEQIFNIFALQANQKQKVSQSKKKD